jgi:hypothetical protein
MSDKIRVDSTRNNEIGINLGKFNGKMIPVSPKGFAYLSEDELTYVINTSDAFKRGILVVMNKEKVSEDIDIPTSPNALSKEDLSAIMKLPQAQLKIKLQEITERKVVQEILENAKANDKSIKFIDIIESRLEELRA